MRKKISIIGAGHVGATTAQLCGMLDLGDITLIDIAEGIAQGKALDIQQSLTISQREASITGTIDISQIAGSKIVVITAGFPRKPGMSREDLIKTNGRVIRDIAKKIAAFAPEAIIINVTNPMDVMTYLLHKVSKIPSDRILGMGGILDSGRFASAITKATNTSPDQVFALVIGMHGNLMVPLPRHSTIYGQSLSNILSQETIESLVTQTVRGGAEIVKLLQTGSAYFAPAAAVVEMLSCLLYDKKKILPCSVFLQGEYGQRDLFIGVPVKLCSQGLKEIVQLDLNSAEKEAFEKSSESVREMIQVLATE